MPTVKTRLRKHTSNYRTIPIYVYSDEGKLIGSYPSRQIFAKKYGVTYAAISRALHRKGKCAGVRVRTAKKRSLPPIIKKNYPLLPVYKIYRYDLRGEPKGIVTQGIWNAMPKHSRLSIVHDLKSRKTKKIGNIYFSLVNGAIAFSVKSRSANKERTRSKGAIIAIFPNGTERIYPQAADAAKDLKLYEERISNVLNGKLESVKGYSFRRT